MLDLCVFLIKEVVIIGHNALPVLLHDHLPRDVPKANRSRNPWLRLLIDTNGLVVDLDRVMRHLEGVWRLRLAVPIECWLDLASLRVLLLIEPLLVERHGLQFGLRAIGCVLKDPAGVGLDMH